MPKIVDGLAPVDGDRLDTGMKVTEAAKRAEHWWNTVGAKMLANSEFTDQASDKNYLASGLLQGLPWDGLTKREKLNVVKVWHHFTIRRPDVLDKKADDKFLMGGLHTDAT